MGEAILTRRGGTSVKLAKLIQATYPKGAECTCTNGGKVLTAPNTEGLALFNVYNGDWLVKITNGKETVEKTVSVSDDVPVSKVSLSFSFTLFSAANGLDSNYSFDGNVISPAIDLTSYSSCKVVGYLSWGSSMYVGFTTESDRSTFVVETAFTDTAKVTKTLNTSGLSGGHFFSAGEDALEIDEDTGELWVGEAGQWAGFITSIILYS